MIVQKLIMRNFRRYEDACFSFHQRFNVLIGNNGRGKTTILDALSIMLNTYLLHSKIATGGTCIKNEDARFVVRNVSEQVFFEPQSDVWLKASAYIGNEHFEWQRDKGDRGKKSKELMKLGEQNVNAVRKGMLVDLPLLLYYGTGRLWNIHRNIQTEKPGAQLDAYRYCLDPKSDQNAFEKWFRRLSYSELQKGTKIPALKSVRDAVICCIPGASEFYYDTAEDQIMIHLEHEGLMPFNSLSDGFRNMIAMVSDIAHRASKLNPHLAENAARETKGIVLIDELDLHLHPKWQRRVALDLQKAFPNLQFITTTHSPFIIQSLKPGQVIDLEQETSCDCTYSAESGVASPKPGAEFSNRSIEDITEDIMGIAIPQRSERYQKMYEVAKEYYKVLQKAQEADESEIERLKQKLDELSAPFSDNVAYYAFLEMERVAAGLGKSSKKGEN